MPVILIELKWNQSTGSAIMQIKERLSTYIILMADIIGREYRASRSRKAACFLMRLCASCYTVRQIYLACSIKDYGGDILLVGINYDAKTKKHTCKIEKYTK